MVVPYRFLGGNILDYNRLYWVDALDVITCPILSLQYLYICIFLGLQNCILQTVLFFVFVFCCSHNSFRNERR